LLSSIRGQFVYSKRSAASSQSPKKSQRKLPLFFFFRKKKIMKSISHKNMNESRRFNRSTLIALLGTILLLHGFAGRALDEQKQTEITIRNMTRETVSYSVTPAVSNGKTEKKILKPGEIQHIPGEVGLDITFETSGKSLVYRLNPGESYSFRYDESNNLELYKGSHGRSDAADLAPFVPTPMSVVDKMLELAGVSNKDIVYDLGSGDGRIVIAAAKKYGAHGVGIELDPRLIRESKAAAKKAGVERLVEFRMEDATRSDISEATVVTLYLLPESNELLRDRLEKELRPGARVVSHNYLIPGWKDKEIAFAEVRTEDTQTHEVYVYRR
jgi:predicted O-methyltransferase YrrM